MAVNHHLVVLTYALAHGVNPNAVNFRYIQAILDRCPESSPRSDLTDSSG
jgi:hypothetical protein